MLPVYNSHERLTIGTEEAIVVAASSETNGALFAIHLRMHPGGGPPVMHRHDPSEVYYVIDGEFTFYVQDVDGHVQRRTAKTGETVPLTGGTTHTVRNESTSDAVAFVVHAPGRRWKASCMPLPNWPRPARSAWNRCWLSPLSTASNCLARSHPSLDPDPARSTGDWPCRRVWR